MSKHIPAPISEGSPYMPVMTYTIACPMVMIIPNTAEREREAESVSVDSFFSASNKPDTKTCTMRYGAKKPYVSELH